MVYHGGVYEPYCSQSPGAQQDARGSFVICFKIWIVFPLYNFFTTCVLYCSKNSSLSWIALFLLSFQIWFLNWVFWHLIRFYSVCTSWGLSCRCEQASPLDAGLSHVTGHQLEPLLQMFGEFRLRPVEVHNKHLQSVQLPEQIFRGGWPITAGTITETVSNRKSQTRNYTLPPGQPTASFQAVGCRFHGKTGRRGGLKCEPAAEPHVKFIYIYVSQKTLWYLLNAFALCYIFFFYNQT